VAATANVERVAFAKLQLAVNEEIYRRHFVLKNYSNIVLNHAWKLFLITSLFTVYPEIIFKLHYQIFNKFRQNL
jgi:hypothetical protein